MCVWGGKVDARLYTASRNACEGGMSALGYGDVTAGAVWRVVRGVAVV